MKNKIYSYTFTLLFCVIAASIFSQSRDTVLLDMGSSLSPAPWNNLTIASDGSIDDLVNTAGYSTGFQVAVVDSFNGVNTAGTQEPDPALGFPPTATGDSFFGNVAEFSGQVQPTGGISLNNLNTDRTYDIQIFASRSATDNREAMYIIDGMSTDTVFLNASSNADMVVTATMAPSDDGSITIIAAPGPNNDNSSGFYYMGVVTLSYDHIDVVLPMDTIFVDFGDNISPAPFNNLADPAGGMIEDLLNAKGNETGYGMAVTDPFNNINRAGTSSPDPAIGFPPTATGDSFFGNVAEFGGQTQPTGAVTMSNLDPDLTYQFTIFASRDASDNREAKYVVEGLGIDSVFLNASSNTSEVAVVNMKPGAIGDITITASPGANNDNSSQFYYLGAMYMTYPEQEEPIIVAVDSILIDFGDNISLEPWINITDPSAGAQENLTTKYGKETGYSIAVTDDFNNINRAGTTSAADSLGFPPTATGDSFFGNVAEFGGQVQPSGAVTLSNLNPANTYTFSIFASREASDNREAKYVVEGLGIDSVFLDAASNTDKVAVVQMKPTSEGDIVITATPGPNNDNSSMFYYLGAMIVSYEDVPQALPFDTLLIDFGDSPSPAPWNNFSDQNEGDIADLINTKGFNSGYGIKIIDDFNGINTNGTVSPDPDLQFPATATGDSFFGNVAEFSSQVQPTAGVALYNLKTDKAYTVSIFASRVASDNRETQYIVKGTDADTLFLNVASNTDSLVTATMIPAADGTISVLVSPGPNNNNSFNFYYLGVMRVTYDEEEAGAEEITLVQPNGGEFWQAGKTVDIKWESKNVIDAIIAYSTDNGSTWTTIDTVAGAAGIYNWTIPDITTTEALVRVSGVEVFDVSDGVFEISSDQATCRIVVLGSSTAAGTGASPRDSSWVNLYAASLADNSAFEVINLAVGGYNTYKILPTGSDTDGTGQTIDEERNITKALSLDPLAVLVNMPSNDAANNYSVETQLKNFALIADAANEAGVDIYIATTQPRNFSNQSQIDIQVAVKDSILSIYGDKAIDFWTGVSDENNMVIPDLDSGDGVHLNNAGHYLLFTRVVDKQLDAEGCNTTGTKEILQELGVESVHIYPNPSEGTFTIDLSSSDVRPASVAIYNTLGQRLMIRRLDRSNTSDTIRIDLENSFKGMLLCVLTYEVDGKKPVMKSIPVMIK